MLEEWKKARQGRSVRTRDGPTKKRNRDVSQTVSDRSKVEGMKEEEMERRSSSMTEQRGRMGGGKRSHAESRTQSAIHVHSHYITACSEKKNLTRPRHIPGTLLYG